MCSAATVKSVGVAVPNVSDANRVGVDTVVPSGMDFSDNKRLVTAVVATLMAIMPTIKEVVFKN